MNAIAVAIRELWGLFVEDASFTLGIVVCLAIAVLLFEPVRLPLSWRGPVLFVLLAIVLVENVARTASAARSRDK